MAVTELICKVDGSCAKLNEKCDNDFDCDAGLRCEEKNKKCEDASPQKNCQRSIDCPLRESRG